MAGGGGGGKFLPEVFFFVCQLKDSYGPAFSSEQIDLLFDYLSDLIAYLNLSPFGSYEF